MGHPGLGPRRKVAEELARDIARTIVEGGLVPGTILRPERVMAADYSVGRASVREALRLLEAQGFIRVRSGPGGGPVVLAYDEHDFARVTSIHLHMRRATFRELWEARVQLEPVMARVAALRRDPDGLAALEAALVALQRIRTRLGDDQAWWEVGTRFHQVVARMSGNGVLDLFGGALTESYAEVMKRHAYGRAARPRVHDIHERIGWSVLRGEADDAERLMRLHMEDYFQYVVRRHRARLNEVVNWD